MTKTASHAKIYRVIVDVLMGTPLHRNALMQNALCRLGLTKEQLLDAQIHPEKYPNLIVRVTGFSARFTALSKEWQQEVLTRNFYE